MFLYTLVDCYMVDYLSILSLYHFFFFFQAEDGIRDLVRSRGLGDVYKRQALYGMFIELGWLENERLKNHLQVNDDIYWHPNTNCLLYTSDAADERSSVDLGGRRIIKKKTQLKDSCDKIEIQNNKQTKHHK